MHPLNPSSDHAGPPFALQLMEALQSLWDLRQRSMLALLGIVVGSASIVALLNIGRNVTAETARIFDSMGADSLVVQFPPGNGLHRKIKVPLNLDTAELLSNVPNARRAAPIAVQAPNVFFKGHRLEVTTVGVTREFLDIAGLTMKQGRFISIFDGAENFVVIGPTAAKLMGAERGAIQTGDPIRIGDYVFTVIGLTYPQPSNPMIPIELDNSLFIPLSSMRRISPDGELNSIVVQVATGRDPQFVSLSLESHLTALLPGRTIAVQSARQLLEGFQRQTRLLKYLLIALGVVSSLMGGVGIMNVMLMSVRERCREIGLRMAIGARSKDIRNHFLLEGILLAITGAFIGALLGLSIAKLCALLSGWVFIFSVSAFLIGISGAITVGLFFGIYPAMTAANLKPIVALRDMH